MAAIAKGTRVRNVTPTGEGYFDKGRATEDIAMGDLLVFTAAGVARCPAGAAEAHGFALLPAVAGGLVEYGKQGEADGFAVPAGVAIGAALYPSATIVGGIDSTAPAGAPVRMRAITRSRIYYNFV